MDNFKIKRRDFVCGALSSLFIPPISFGETKKEEIIKIVKSKWGRGDTLKILYPKGSLANVKVVSNIFTEKTGVNVILQEGVLDEISSQLIVENSLSDQSKNFDLALPPTFSIPDLVETKTIASLDKYLKKYRKLKTSSIYEYGETYKGHFYGPQTDGDVYLLFLNYSLVSAINKKKYQDKFGVNLTTPKSWEELDQQIRYIHNPDQNIFGGTLFRNKDYLTWEFIARLRAKGISLVDSEMNPLFASEVAIQTLEEMISLNNYLHPSVSKNGLFDNFKLFSEGNSFCNIGWGGTQKYIVSNNKKLASQLKYSLLPGGESQKIKHSSMFNWGWNYVVSRRTKFKELAFLYAMFATSVSMSLKSVEEAEGFFDPYLYSHYESPKVKNTYMNSFLEIHKKALKESTSDFYMQGHGQYMAALNSALFSASEKRLPFDVALRKAGEKWQRITNEIGRNSQINQLKTIMGN